jgi:tRNA G10  N-methylase Trm11
MRSREALSVWPVAQLSARSQRRERYLAASTAHPGKMLPALARAAISHYSQRGELVVDPMCGIGTTLVEAAHLERRAIGVELEPQWASVAAGNVLRAQAQGASGRALVLRGDARDLGAGLLDGLAGEAALILTSPPYGPSLHGSVRVRTGRPVERWGDRYSDNPDNLASLPDAASEGRPPLAHALARIIAGCRRLLAPDGRLVITARPYRRAGRLVNLPGELISLAEEAGFALEARHAALLCGLREDRLVPRASFFQISKQRSGTTPRMLVIGHEDVLVFAASDGAGTQPH